MDIKEMFSKYEQIGLMEENLKEPLIDYQRQ